MSDYGLTCPRCGGRSMIFKRREGRLECESCLHKELVDGDFDYSEYNAMLRKEDEEYRNKRKRGLRAELSGVVDDAPLYE